MQAAKRQESKQYRYYADNFEGKQPKTPTVEADCEHERTEKGDKVDKVERTIERTERVERTVAAPEIIKSTSKVNCESHPTFEDVKKSSKQFKSAELKETKIDRNERVRSSTYSTVSSAKKQHKDTKPSTAARKVPASTKVIDDLPTKGRERTKSIKNVFKKTNQTDISKSPAKETVRVMPDQGHAIAVTSKKASKVQSPLKSQIDEELQRLNTIDSNIERSSILEFERIEKEC